MPTPPKAEYAPPPVATVPTKKHLEERKAVMAKNAAEIEILVAMLKSQRKWICNLIGEYSSVINISSRYFG
jgi:hypothetical protein